MGKVYRVTSGGVESFYSTPAKALYFLVGAGFGTEESIEMAIMVGEALTKGKTVNIIQHDKEIGTLEVLEVR